MHQGIEVFAFHAHFPTALPWFQGMASAPANSAGRRAAQAMPQPYNEQWRRMGDFPAPERAEDHPGDEEQARRGQQELTQNGIRAIGFVTGGGNDNLVSAHCIRSSSQASRTTTLSPRTPRWEKIMTAASLASVPLLCLFMLFQRQIIAGVALTGMKG